MLFARFGRALVGSACIFLSGALWAGTVEVSPVIASLSVGHAIQAFTVRNTGDTPVTAQVALMTWQQVDGRDVLTPTDELLSTPPLFSVAPGQSQIVRVGMRHAAFQDKEVSYRMFLTEVPAPPQPGFRGLTVTLRLSVPIFVEPSKPKPPALTWRVMKGSDGGALVDVVNSGSVHAKIISLSMLDKQTKSVMRQTTSQYVLANNHGQWNFAAFRPVQPGDHVQINAKTDAGDISTDVVVQSP
jgi:fimbrial chaperone protein